MKSETRIAIGTAVVGALAAAMWLAPRAQAFGADSPIIVRDGSIRIENPGGDLKTWKRAGSAVLDHPVDGSQLRAVEVTGPGAHSATCEGKGRCLVEMTWSTGHSVQVASRGNGSKGMRIIVSGVSFDDAGWDKSGSEWKFELPAGAVPVVTIRDQSTNGQAEKICEGTGCRVVVHYQ
jgi:hypothetical protein